MSEKKKVFVIDTNVVLFDPHAIFEFEDNDIVIPDVLIEEIDHFKNEKNMERGRNSRAFSRMMDDLAEKTGGSFLNGISLGEGKGTISIHFTNEADADKKFEFDTKIFDNRVLWLCKDLQRKSSSKKIILVTKDVNLRVKARTLGVVAEDYKSEKVVFEDNKPYLGRTVAYLSDEDAHRFKLEGFVDVGSLKTEDWQDFSENLYLNEFIELHSASGGNSVIPARFDGQAIVKMQYAVKGISLESITPRNIGQIFMTEALLQPPTVAPLVVIKGVAGTAKTLFALAAALNEYDTNDKTKKYSRILICRPSVTMDEDIGFLPGSEKEKISPYMRAIKDNVFTILYNGKDDIINSPMEYSQAEDEVERMFEDDYIKTEALAFQRGRSLNNYFFILDEMQNSTKNQAKACVTRVGENTKVVMIGDTDQIDSPYLDSRTNGLAYTSEAMKGSKYCWQITMRNDECERSKLAEEAAKRM